MGKKLLRYNKNVGVLCYFKQSNYSKCYLSTVTGYFHSVKGQVCAHGNPRNSFSRLLMAWL